MSERKKGKRCKCAESVNDQLKEKTVAVLVRRLQMDFDKGEASLAGPFLQVEWHSKPKGHKSLPTLLCAYCPFCGKPQP